MMTGNRSLTKYRLLFYALIAFCFLSNSVEAKDAVSGKYVAINASRIEFSINIAAPAPPNLIVQHYYAKDAQLTSTTPRASMINNNQGFAKWFLKSVTPGTIPFVLSFKKPISNHNVKAILRYQDPTTGRFIETLIVP